MVKGRGPGQRSRMLPKCYDSTQEPRKPMWRGSCKTNGTGLCDDPVMTHVSWPDRYQNEPGTPPLKTLGLRSAAEVRLCSMVSVSCAWQEVE